MRVVLSNWKVVRTSNFVLVYYTYFIPEVFLTSPRKAWPAWNA